MEQSKRLPENELRVRIYNKAMSKIDVLTRTLINLDTELVNADEDLETIQLQIRSVDRDLQVWNEIMLLNELKY